MSALAPLVREIAGAVEAIMQPGAARGRDLRGDWHRLVADRPGGGAPRRSDLTMR